MQRLKLFFEYFSLDVLAFFLKEHLHKVIGFFVLLVGFIFVCAYFVERENSKNEKLVSQYVVAANYFAQKDYVLALKHAQSVYNNAENILEIASLMKIVEILFVDGQDQKIFEVIADGVNLTQKGENAFLLYSFIFQTIQKLEERGFDSEKLVILARQMQTKLENIDVNLQNKAMLLTEVNGMTKVYDFDYYIKKYSGDLKDGEIKNILLSVFGG